MGSTIRAMALPLHTTDQIHALEARLAQAHGLSASVLMQRAGAALLRHLRANWPEARRLLVVAGTGNNGGDGYVLARLWRAAGGVVQVLALGPPRAEAAAEAAQAWQAAGGVSVQWQDGMALPPADVIVDAVFGIGLSRPPEAEAAALIAAINASGRPVLAVDLPSGITADSGAVADLAVRATRTLSLLARKRGLYTGTARDHVGALALAELDCAALQTADAACVLLDRGDLRGALSARRPGAHKGDHGHVLVIGGDAGMTGAVRLAGEAALRAGAGWVSLASHVDHAAALGLGRPELMVHGVEDAPALAPLLARADVIAIGPGLGQGEWSRALLAASLARAHTATVLDADALNLLALQPSPVPAQTVITPHPGEAARLLGTSVAEVERDRFAAARTLAQRLACVVVLKGAGTVIDDGERCAVCPYGNPGMASAGMGDALTGLIAALLAQGLVPFAAATMGVLGHALAGDRAACDGQRGLLASDVIAQLRAVLNP